jgi:hypothetical protein
MKEKIKNVVSSLLPLWIILGLVLGAELISYIPPSKDGNWLLGFIIMPEDIFTISLTVLIEFLATVILVYKIIEASNNENRPFIEKYVLEYDYKDKIIPYSKFEKKYKKSKNNRRK